jgi:diguanylate cyclase (GGDEF)-like protein
VVARRPAAVAFAAATETGFWILGIGGLIGLLAIGSAMLLAGRIARPMQSITREADLIGRDPSATMLPRQRGSREAIQLTYALRSLLRRVGFAEERTREVETQASEDARLLNGAIKELRQLASTDPLTSLMNRRAFLDAAQDAMAYQRRYRRGLSALMIDIDHFKKINDIHGHAAGDEVIKTVAGIISECVRATDKVARFGGEEFVVLLREANLEATNMLAERLRSSVEASIVTVHGVEISATVSVGISIVYDSDRDVQDLIERGRNRVFQMLGHRSMPPIKAA